MNRIEVIDEIKQITIQYQAEVGRGRKAWPKSIKDRVALLFETGMKAPAIAEATGLAYYTILKWRPGGRCAARGIHASKFKELALANAHQKLVTVTEPKKSVVGPCLEVVTVTMTTPDHFSLKVDGLAAAIELLKRVRMLSGER